MEPDLFALYPQETATLAVSRRDDMEAAATVIRHPQSISHQCRLLMYNAMSLETDTNDVGRYNAMIGWDLSNDVEASGYDRQLEEDNLEPGDVRDDLHDRIPDHPFFALATGDEEEVGLIPVWLGPEGYTEPPLIDYEEGTVVTERPSEPYIECMEEAEEAEDDPDQEPPDCDELVQFEVATAEPGGEAADLLYYYWPSTFGLSGDQCNQPFRIFTDFANVFEGEHMDGERIDHTAPDDHVRGNHYFVTLYGRSVNPGLETWLVSDRLEELPDYPGGHEPSTEAEPEDE